MNRKIAAVLVALSIVIGVVAGFLVQRLNDEEAQAKAPTSSPSTPNPSTPADSSPSASTLEVSPLVARNRDERAGQPAWSPADPTGPDGKPLELGNIVPGAVQPVRIGDPVEKYVRAGYIVEDLQREEICEGEHYKWTGGLDEALDVLVGDDGTVSAIGIRQGLETPEGIAVGNTYGALKRTYGPELTRPRPTDYGEAGVHLQGNGDGWIGFLLEATPDKLTDATKIVFMEVAEGREPGLLRDGC